MSVNEWSFSVVEQSQGRTDTLRDYIRTVLRLEGDKAFQDMYRYLTPPGVEGSRSWDHKAAVDILLDADMRYDRAINSYMEDNGMSKSQLWPELVKVLRRAGFDMQQGKLVGLLEYKPADKE